MIKRRNWTTYPVLEEILQEKQIASSILAKVLGIAEQNVSKKMRGEQRISLSQQTSIKAFLGVDITLEELFRKA